MVIRVLILLFITICILSAGNTSDSTLSSSNNAKSTISTNETNTQNNSYNSTISSSKADNVSIDTSTSSSTTFNSTEYSTGITYKELARTPDNYMDKKVKFTGTVIQVMEGDSETDIRLAVNDNYDNVLYCAIPKELTNNNRILENDSITIYGTSGGLVSYNSTMGEKITIPGIEVDKFQLN